MATMDTTTLAVLGIIAVLAVLALLAWARQRRNRSHRLHAHFGTEYDRAVATRGRSTAEKELQAREERVSQRNIRPLLPFEADRFQRSWASTQARFVDEPGAAVADADRLVCDVMLSRGYEVGDFEQRAEDVSVDHGDVVSNYRAAHALAQKHGRGQATTEDLRRAMVHYRVLFHELCDNATTVPNLDDRADSHLAAGSRPQI